MLHDVALHDVIGGERFMAHRILHLAKTTRDKIINSLRENN